MNIDNQDFNQNVIQILGRTFLTPKSWNDLTLKQKLVCNDVLMSLNAASFIQKRIALMQFLAEMDDTFLQYWRESEADNEMWALDLKAVTETVTDFLFTKTLNDDGTEKFAISPTMTVCPYPKVILTKKRKGKEPKEVKLYAAADGLANMSYSEMADVFTCFDRYGMNGDEKHIHRALAVVFRPSKPNDAANRATGFDGDRRTALEQSDEVIEYRAKLWETVPGQVKRLLWFWIVSCREQIIKQNPQVFKNGTSDALMRRLAVYSWAGVAIEMSKGDVLARKAIESSNYQDIFITLSYLETKSEVTEKKAKKAA